MLLKAIDYSKENEQTKGRNRIITLGLDSESFASRLIEIYQSSLLNKQSKPC